MDTSGTCGKPVFSKKFCLAGNRSHEHGLLENTVLHWREKNQKKWLKRGSAHLPIRMAARRSLRASLTGGWASSWRFASAAGGACMGEEEGGSCSRRAWRGRRGARRRRSGDNKPAGRRRMSGYVYRARHQSRMGRWPRKLKGTNKCCLCWWNHGGRRRRGRTCRIVIFHHLSWKHPI